MLLRLASLVAALWTGSLWTISALIVPVLFSTLPSSMAGQIAGRFFHIEAWLSMACAVALLLILRVAGLKEKKAGAPASFSFSFSFCDALIIAMAICTLIGYFGLHPFMAALKETAGATHTMTASAQYWFGILHLASSIFYLLQSVLGIMLIIKLPSRLQTDVT